MEFTQDYLENWKITAKETLANKKVRQFLDEIVKGGHFDEFAEQITGRLLNELNESMQRYANSWSGLSDKHKESGLYTKIANFIQPSDGLLVDICCGSGNLLVELNERLHKKNMLGIDINGYCLQACQENLSQHGMQSTLNDASYISFHPMKGFILKPKPVLEELDLSKTNLLCDDAETLHNTMRVLYNQGIKADTLLFTLSGGNSYKQVEFINILRKLSNLEDSLLEEQCHLSEIIVDTASKICYKGGKVYIAQRASALGFENGTYTTVPGLDLAKSMGEKFSDKLKLERYDYLPMPDESNGTGITIDMRTDNDFRQLAPEQEEMVRKQGYGLVLLEMKVL